jgi:hypothetical protein
MSATPSETRMMLTANYTLARERIKGELLRATEDSSGSVPKRNQTVQRFQSRQEDETRSRLVFPHFSGVSSSGTGCGYMIFSAWAESSIWTTIPPHWDNSATTLAQPCVLNSENSHPETVKESLEMKKLLTLLFAVALTFSLSAVSFAQDTSTDKKADSKKEAKADKKSSKKTKKDKKDDTKKDDKKSDMK